MNFTHAIIFFDENKQPLKITAEEYVFLKTNLNKNQFVELKRPGEAYNRSDIRRIEKLKVEKLALPEHSDPPITKNFLKKFKEEISKKFTA